MLPAPSPVAGPTAPPAPLRVVHLVWTLDDGGQGNVVFDLARMLNPERFDVRVLCLGGVGTLGPRFQAANVPVESLAVVGKSSLGAFRRVWRRLRELKPDVLHTHNHAPHLIGAVAARCAGVGRVVHTKHDSVLPEGRGKEIANHIASFLTSCIVPVSSDAAGVALDREVVNPRKVRVILNGVDLDRFALRPPPEGDARLRAVHVARLTNALNNQRTLLRAARVVADAVPGFRLDVVGDGPDRGDLEAYCGELGLRDRVLFHGWRDDVPRRLAAAGYFVLSSRTDGVSLALLEAMSTGLPVVATRVLGNSEAVADGDTGLLVPSECPEALADAMLTVLRDPARAAEMGRRGRLRAEERFDVRTMVGQYEDLYLRLTGRRPA